MNNDKEMIMKKLDFYLEKKVMVHIGLVNKKFYNARIVEKESDDVYIVNERFLGLMHLWVDEVFSVSEFIEQGGREI